MNTYIVYRHTNLENQKVYIGISKNNSSIRWQDGMGYKTQSLFFEDIVKYGWLHFKHEILYKNLSESDAKFIEEDLIYHYKHIGMSYNIFNRGYKQNHKSFDVYDMKLNKIIPCPTLIDANYYMLYHDECRIASKIDKIKINHRGGKSKITGSVICKATGEQINFDSIADLMNKTGMHRGTATKLIQMGENRKYKVVRISTLKYCNTSS